MEQGRNQTFRRGKASFASAEGVRGVGMAVRGGGAGGMLPQKILDKKGSKMLFLTLFKRHFFGQLTR